MKKLTKWLMGISVLLISLITIYWLNVPTNENKLPVNDIKTSTIQIYNDTIRENGLFIIYPHFSNVDLVCDSMPSKNDDTVILVAEAAYTGECLNDFRHSNIAGDHVAGGKRYKGYRCSRNTGAFVYYKGRWKFLHKQYNNELDSAARYGGAGFAQELIMLNGDVLTTPRKDGSKNIFRALCEKSEKLCIVESDTITTFADFKQHLKMAEITNAIYLDMGNGWNHAWYRDTNGIVELHPKKHNYCTNWITFYK